MEGANISVKRLVSLPRYDTTRAIGRVSRVQVMRINQGGHVRVNMCGRCAVCGVDVRLSARTRQCEGGLTKNLADEAHDPKESTRILFVLVKFFRRGQRRKGGLPVHLLSNHIGIVARFKLEAAVVRPQIDRGADAGDAAFVDLAQTHQSFFFWLYSNFVRVRSYSPSPPLQCPRS